MSEVVHFRNTYPPTPVKQAFYAQVSEDALVSAASDRAFRLYVHLLTFCKKKHGNKCWPSQALLVERTGWSERTVRTYLKELEQEGLITIDPPQLPLRAYNIYELHMMPEVLTSRQDIAGRPADLRRPTGKTDRQHVAAETHESRNMNLVCEGESILVESELSQNTRIQGYVVLLQEVGLAGRATELAGKISPDRDQEWLKGWINYPGRKGQGLIVDAINHDWDLPAVKVVSDKPGASRSGKKPSKGQLFCPKCNRLKRENEELCYNCSQKAVEE